MRLHYNLQCNVEKAVPSGPFGDLSFDLCFSVEGYEKKLSAEARSKNLLVRRERLRALLKREREQYESELIKTRTTGGVVQVSPCEIGFSTKFNAMPCK